MLIYFILIFLPLLEIAGFIIIGGKIGVGLSFLWLVCDVIAGLGILAGFAGPTLQRTKKSLADDVYPFEEMFDGFCIIVGALLLIFPGFVSDFLALPLLLAPVRGWIFGYLKDRHDSFFNTLSSSSRGFASWYYEDSRGTHRGKTDVIEGEFRNDDDPKHLP